MGKELKDCFSGTDSIKIGKNTYITGKVNISDIINFQRWCDKEAKRELVELSELTGVKPTLKELRSLAIEPELYDQKSSSVEGVVQLFLSVIKRLNKDVDEEYIINNITTKDIENISSLISEDEEIKEMEEVDKNDPANFPKLGTKHAKKKS